MPLLISMEFPRIDADLSIWHETVSSTFADGFTKLAESLALIFGESATHACLRTLLVESSYSSATRDFRRKSFDDMGWREYLKVCMDDSPIDSADLTQFCRAAAEYALLGLAPDEHHASASLANREARVRALIDKSGNALKFSGPLFDHQIDQVWKAVEARAAIDFGGRVTVDGLVLLSGLTLAIVRNAVSMGALRPDADGCVTSDEALAWLARRREFRPSRWLNLSDAQESFDPKTVSIPDSAGNISVPQAGNGDIFEPIKVTRVARGKALLSITIGAKDEEVRYGDFYEALQALATMKVARWRRPNDAGNWGIVRARGNWVAVSKADIDRQIADKLAEMS